MDIKAFLHEAAHVRPSKRQLDWFDLGMYAFVHFGMNTFTDQEWGDGSESPALFNPKKLDCDQWVSAIKAAGLRGMVLTAKHHDGFCLWPSALTEHSVKKSPFGRDIVREASDACMRQGIPFGFYLSPWDRHEPTYGSDAYNEYFCGQLTELLTGYGDIFYVWFDGACAEGTNGKKQVYDFPRYIELVRRYQPNAVIFFDKGPDIRWCGNEAGIARHAEWAVVPQELCAFCEVQSGPGPLSDEGDLSFLYNTHEDLGSLPSILYAKGLVFAPSEYDMSIRPGWFWHEAEEPHGLERLFRTWLTSVGGNACLNLNIPPNREGLFDERDVRRLCEFGSLIQREFGHPIAIQLEKRNSTYPSQPSYYVRIRGRERVRYIVLREDIAQGQRVESFQIESLSAGGSRFPLYQGTTIGNRKICVLSDPFSTQNPLLRDGEEDMEGLIIKIRAARGPVVLKEISLF